MLDLKSKLILKILAKECGDGNYKIIEIPDIIMSLPRHYRMESDAVRHTLSFLERQDMISIKYDDEDVFCLSVLPYGFQTLEDEKPRLKKEKFKDKKAFPVFVISFLSALFGTIIGIVVCFFLLKLL